MRAIGLMKHGGPEVLELIEVPEVKAEADEICLLYTSPSPRDS